MEILFIQFIQMMHESQFQEIDSYDWFCAPYVLISLSILLPSQNTFCNMTLTAKMGLKHRFHDKDKAMSVFLKLWNDISIFRGITKTFDEHVKSVGQFKAL